MLEPDHNGAAYGVKVGGYLAATLGHGITPAGEGGDTRAHAFLGDYGKVIGSLERLLVRDGVFESEGVERDEKTEGVFGCNLEASDSVQNPLIRSDFVCTASKI